METNVRWSRRMAVAGVAVALVAGGCAMMAPRAERWTQPPLGSSWDLVQRNTGSYGKDVQLRMTLSQVTWQGAPALSITNSMGASIILASNGHWMAVVGPDGRPMIRWDSPLGFDYPLEVGKTSTKAYRMTLGNGRVVPYTLTCTTQAFEKVTVKAGTFDTFRVACTTDIGNDEVYWTSPDMGVFVKTRLIRTDKSPFGPGTQDSELVSAPAKRP